MPRDSILKVLGACALLLGVLAVKSWTLAEKYPDPYATKIAPILAEMRSLNQSSEKWRQTLTKSKDPLAELMKSGKTASGLAGGWKKVRDDLSQLRPTIKYADGHPSLVQTTSETYDMYNGLAAAIASKSRERVVAVCREFSERLAFNLRGA